MSRATFGSLSWRSRSLQDIAAKSCPTFLTSLFEGIFLKYFTDTITILRWRVMRKFGLVPWRSRSQHDLAAKTCPVFWSRTSKLFHRNHQHIETTCHMQYLCCYLEGQGHSMILQQNRVWPKTLLFEVGFHNYFWQTTSLFQYLFREHYPVLTRSCFSFNLTYVFHGIAPLILLIIFQCLMLTLLRIPLCQHYFF